MTHDARPEFVPPIGQDTPGQRTAPHEAPRGRSPQRQIQRPRIPDPTWSQAIAKAHRIDKPIGHVITELLDQWLKEDGK